MFVLIALGTPHGAYEVHPAVRVKKETGETDMRRKKNTPQREALHTTHTMRPRETAVRMLLRTPCSSS